MENTFVWLFLSLVFLQLCQNSQSQLVPALHIFGDSAVDVGNSLYLNTSFKADFAPYGIDFVVGQSGRFSNGDLIADALAAALGLELPYAIVNGTNTVNFFYNDNQAFNYAYGTAGILPETGEAMGETLGLGQQIRLFKEIVKTHLPQQFNSSEQVFRYISDSFFAVFVGSNDYIHNYLQPKSYNSSRQYKFDEFAELLVQELQSLGAKRMVVFEIPPIGCYPIVLENVKSNTRCAENVNNMVSIFNDELGEKVKELSSTLKDSTIILAKTYGLVYDMVNNSSAYGFEEAAEPCCVVGKDGSGLCEPDKTPCEKRNTTLFWDQAHISQAASEKIAMEVFNGSGFTMPVNMVDAIKSGAAKPPTSESEPPTSISEPPASDSEPPTSNSEPPASDSEPPASDSEPPTSDSEPPTPEHSGAKPSSVSYFNLLMFSAFSAVLSYL